MYGSLQTNCDENGQCICKKGFTGIKCTSCKDGFFGPKCKPCNCYSLGSYNDKCQQNGSCNCTPGFHGKKCTKCKNIKNNYVFDQNDEPLAEDIFFERLAEGSHVHT